jgi:site-specific DNA-cytosine methylase
MSESSAPHDYTRGTHTPWYRGWNITDEKRAFFRKTSQRSREAKLRALRGEADGARHPINVPLLDPYSLMPQERRHGILSLSLFSGGGGLDLGFDRAGFQHVASFDALEAAGRTLVHNRPQWAVPGSEGDVRTIDWRGYRNSVDVLHGGPPCQPFSAAGRQRGHEDERNLLPEFVRAVREIRPSVFVAENVRALAGPKFAPYLKESFYGPLGAAYHITMFQLGADAFGVPQVRHRVFLVGFRWKRDSLRFAPPAPTHRSAQGDGRTLRRWGHGRDLVYPTVGSMLQPRRSAALSPGRATHIRSEQRQRPESMATPWDMAQRRRAHARGSARVSRAQRRLPTLGAGLRAPSRLPSGLALRRSRLHGLGSDWELARTAGRLRFARAIHNALTK